MSDWLEKAKQAAKDAATGAKNLAEKAKNADYGQMLDKTKAMAKDAVEETKKAAESFKSKTEEKVEEVKQEVRKEEHLPDPQTAIPIVQNNLIKSDMKQYIQQIEQIEALLADLKKKLQQE